MSQTYNSKLQKMRYVIKLYTAFLILIFFLLNSTSAHSQIITNVSATSGNSYTLGKLVAGTTVYSDRTYEATSVPASLNNATFIKTPNDDKASKATALLSFTLTQNATVYVAYDPRATALPAWLSSWQKLASQLGINDPNISNLVLYSKNFVAGKVTLGGNLASPAAGALNMYLVIALAQTQYNLSVTIHGNGTVTKNPNQASYTSGTSVSLTAKPATGAHFTGWSGAASGTLNPLTITMDANKSVTATFAASSSQPSIITHPVSIYDNDVSGGPAGISRKVTVKNTGTAVLSLSSVNITGTNTNQFVLSGLPGFPKNINAGDSVSFSVAFNPTSTGLKTASINIKSNDPAKPSIAIPLRALGTSGLGGANEPSLQAILNLLQIQANAGDDDIATAVINSNTTLQKAPLLGDEVSIQQFQKAGVGNVTITPLAVFGPTTNSTVVGMGWYRSGNASSTSEMFSVSNNPVSNGQTVNVNFTGTLSFDPGSNAFGFYSRWPYFNNRHLYSEDSLNTFAGSVPHHVRVYPYKKNGTSIPNSYLVAFEETTSKLDYQDIIFLVNNVKKSMVNSATLNAVKVYSGKKSAADTGITFQNLAVAADKNNVSVYEFQKPEIFPNPLHDNFTLKFPKRYRGIYHIQLMDITGRKYDLGETKLNTGVSLLNINISKLSLKPGLYFLRINSTADNADLLKVVIQ